MSNTCTWNIEGMHCASCERVISNELKTLPGVADAQAKLSSKKATVHLSTGAVIPTEEDVNRVLAPYGYRVASSMECDIPAPRLAFMHRLAQAGLAIIAVSVVGWVVLGPFLRAVPALQAGTSLAALFGFGIVASLSTCLASTGAFLLAYSAESHSKQKLVLVHLGRLSAFVVGGALLGGIGGALPSDVRLYGTIALVLGIGFLMVGLHLLDLAPSLASLGIRLPGSLNRLQGRVMKSDHGVAPFLAGAVTFVLPCGFTQTAQALALSSGSAAQGAFMMGAFALGTLPALVGITAFGGSQLLKGRAFRLAAGAVLTIFALGQIDGALTVFGSTFTLAGFGQRVITGATQVTSIPAAQAQEQLVQMTVQYGTYTPRNFVLKKNVPVRWEINGVDVGGCADTITAPSIGITRRLQPGLNLIQFTPNRSGTIPFSCGMGMIRGSFTVVD